MTQEKRLAKRHPIKVNATVITPTAFIPVITVDINTDGIRITSPDPILPETDVALSLATGEETLLSGAILWVLEIDKKENAPLYDVGIEIDSIILKEHEAIEFADRKATVAKILSRTRQTADAG
jgi:hypothetical protein